MADEPHGSQPLCPRRPDQRPVVLLAHLRQAPVMTADAPTRPDPDQDASSTNERSERLGVRSEILPDEKGPTCAGFLARAATYFADRGITRIERVMTDNAWAYRWSLPRSSPARHSSSRTAPGRTGRSSASTAPWPPSGPTGSRSSPATPNAPRPLPPGSSTTTLDDATAHSATSHRTADCYQPD